METLATLALDVRVPKADEATASLNAMKGAAKGLEDQFARTGAAQRDAAIAQGLSGTAAGQAEKSMRSLVEVYGVAFNTSRSYAMSVDATTKLLLQNAKSADALAREHLKAAKQVEALTRAYDPLGAEIMKTNRLLGEATKIQGGQGAIVDGLSGKLANLQKAHAATGEAARLQSYQLLNLGRQGADVFVSLASGQALWMVAIQQGAQIGEVFAEAATQGVGFKAALAGIAAQVGPMLAVVAPIIAIGGAIAIVTKAAIDGEAAVNDFSNAVALTGNSANLTADQYEQMVSRVALSTQSGFGTARETILGLVSSGKVSGDAIETLALGIVNLSEYTGKSTDEITRRFTGMKGSVADFAREFHDDYSGLISPSIIKHIGELEEQGRRADATRVLYSALLNDLAEKGPAKIGVMESAFKSWNDVLGVTLGLLSGIANKQAGAAAANQVNVAQLRNQIDSDKAILNSPFGFLANRPSIQAQIDDNQRRLDALLGSNKPKPTGGGGGNSATATAAAEETELRLRRQLAEADKSNADTRLKLAESVARNDAAAKGIGGGALESIVKLARQVEQKNIDRDAASAARSGATAANRAVRAGNRGDNAVEQARAAELTAQLATTRDLETIAGIKAAQIAQELTSQKVRLAGLVEEKRVTAADAASALASYERAAGYKRQALAQETASQILERDLAQQQVISQYTDRTAAIRAAMAGTVEEANDIERKVLLARQADEAKALEARTLIKAATDDRALAEGIAARQAQIANQTAEQEQQAREHRLRIFQRDLELTQAGQQNAIAVLQSQQALAQSQHAAALLERQIAQAQYEAETVRLSRIIANTDIDDQKHAIAEGDLATLKLIHANNLRALDLSDNMATAYSDLVQALAGAASAIQQGDIGGALTAGAGVLRQLSGLTPAGGLSKAFASAASVAGPIGAAVSAATSVLGAIGDSSAAKAQAKIDRLTKAVEDLRADNKTSSGSIAAALADANANWNADLEYSSAMLSALRSIDAKTGAVASLVARQVSTGRLLNTDGLGLGSTTSKGSVGAGLFGAGLTGAAMAGGTSLLMGGFAGALALGPMGLVAGAVGALVGALTKTKTTTEVLDQGLQFAASTFDEITKGGVSGSSYADLLSTTKKSLLGIGYSTKVKTSTVTGDIDAGLLSQISGVIEALGDGVLSSAEVFGVEAARAAEAALGSAVVDLGKLSLKGLKADEISEVLNATFDRVGDQLAAAGVPGLEELASVGEGAFETLTRLAREYQVVDVALMSIGMSFKTVGLESIAARDGLVQMLGGVDEFSSKTSFFAQNFLTEAERLSPIQAAVTKELERLGVSAGLTRDQYKSLVLAQDVSTSSGASMYAALLQLAPAFDKVATAAEETAAETVRIAQEAVTAAQAEQARIAQYLADQATSAYERQVQAAQASAEALGGVISKFIDLSKTLNDFADSLGVGELSGLTGQAAYSATKSRLMSASGEATPDAIRAFLAASREVSASDASYRMDVAFAEALARSRSTAAMGTVNWLAGLPGFANGGAMTIAGNPGIDQNVVSVNNVPVARVNMGETMSFTPAGGANDNSMAAAIRELAAEMRSANARLAKIEGNTEDTNGVLKNGVLMVAQET